MFRKQKIKANTFSRLDGTIVSAIKEDGRTKKTEIGEKMSKGVARSG